MPNPQPRRSSAGSRRSSEQGPRRSSAAAGRVSRPRTSFAPTIFRWALRLLVVGYVFFLVAWPTFLVLERAFAHGVAAFFESFEDPAIAHALSLTWTITFWAVLINLVFGVATSLLLVRYDFVGKRIYSVLLDIPLSVSPIVVGLALMLVYNSRDGWFGHWLGQQGIQILFSVPGIVMATVFVALPLVIREVVPVLQELGDEQEQAARSLGANGFQVFRRITLPGIKWAVTYGVVLALARSIGEFGAVKIVSGNVVGSSQTATLAVEQTYENFQPEQSYAIAALLALIAMTCLLIVAVLRHQSSNRWLPRRSSAAEGRVASPVDPSRRSSAAEGRVSRPLKENS